MAKVLVVDDERTQAEVLTMLLTLEGFEVSVAHNGKEAIAQLDRLQPDIIISDYMMPLLNGGEMARLVRTTTSHDGVPIVMTSAHKADSLEEYSDHFDAFFRKPYLWDDLLGTIRTLLGRRRQRSGSASNP